MAARQVDGAHSLTQQHDEFRSLPSSGRPYCSYSERPLIFLSTDQWCSTLSSLCIDRFKFVLECLCADEWVEKNKVLLFWQVKLVPGTSTRTATRAASSAARSTPCSLPWSRTSRRGRRASPRPSSGRATRPPSQSSPRSSPRCARTPRAVLTCDVRGVLPDVEARCTIVHCTRDAVAPLAVARYMQRAVAGAADTVVIESCGHFPQLTAPMEFVRVLEAVLLHH